MKNLNFGGKTDTRKIVNHNRLVKEWSLILMTRYTGFCHCIHEQKVVQNVTKRSFHIFS